MSALHLTPTNSIHNSTNYHYFTTPQSAFMTHQPISSSSHNLNSPSHDHHHHNHPHDSKTKSSFETNTTTSSPALSDVRTLKDNVHTSSSTSSSPPMMTTMTPVAIQVFNTTNDHGEEDHHSSSSSVSSSSLSLSSASASSPMSHADSQILCGKSTTSKRTSPKSRTRTSTSKSSPKPSSHLTVNDSSPPPTRISKYACQKSKKKSKINIPVFELIRVMALPQTSAAQVLGVSLSTLKRRYYELGIGRWPGQIANNPKEIEKATESSPEKKVQLSFLLNGEDVEARQIDQITWSILNFTFKQSF
nr:unnamed protein product [Naegleria fowleri]